MKNILLQNESYDDIEIYITPNVEFGRNIYEEKGMTWNQDNLYFTQDTGLAMSALSKNIIKQK